MLWGDGVLGLAQHHQTRTGEQIRVARHVLSVTGRRRLRSVPDSRGLLIASDGRRDNRAVATVHEVIEAFRQAPSNVERGTKFEQLMVRYFELDPLLAAKYDQVWRWIDWPDRKGKVDTGIDFGRPGHRHTDLQDEFRAASPGRAANQSPCGA